MYSVNSSEHRRSHKYPENQNKNTLPLNNISLRGKSLLKNSPISFLYASSEHDQWIILQLSLLLTSVSSGCKYVGHWLESLWLAVVHGCRGNSVVLEVRGGAATDGTFMTRLPSLTGFRAKTFSLASDWAKMSRCFVTSHWWCLFSYS